MVRAEAKWALGARPLSPVGTLGHSGAEPAQSSSPGRYAFVRTRSPSSSLPARVQHLLDEGVKLARQRRYRSDGTAVWTLIGYMAMNGRGIRPRALRGVPAAAVGGSSSRLGNPR